MIQASELRVGNWVKCIKDDFDLFIRVRGVSVSSNKEEKDSQFYGVYEYFLELNDFDFLDSGKGLDAFVNYHRGVKRPEDIEGIPLTEDWLLKFGARQIDKYTFTLKGLFFHKRKIGIVFNVGKKKIILDFVHNIQNLVFSLTGEELTI